MTDEQLKQSAHYYGILVANMVLNGEVHTLTGDQVASLISAHVASIALALGYPSDWDVSPYVEEAATQYNKILIAAILRRELGGEDVDD